MIYDDMIAALDAMEPQDAARLDQIGAKVRANFDSVGIPWNEDTLLGFMLGCTVGTQFNKTTVMFMSLVGAAAVREMRR